MQFLINITFIYRNGQKHIVAPRLFCDICDMFDLHDTEDCPRQAMDSPPPQQMHKPLPRGYQRPYCDICEGTC